MSTSTERTEHALDRLLADLAAGGPRRADAAGPMSPDPDPGPDPATARTLFRVMLTSRALDVAARRLKADGRGFYTISSAGHEHAAIVGMQLRATDPAFLHYRSGALLAARLRDRLPEFVASTVASFQASTTDPVSAGRHKVWGSREAWVPPQTSTIASHLPKAVGTAVALGQAGGGRLGATDLVDEIGPAAIVCVSFGDASLNHATAGAAFTMARWARRHGLAVPVLFLCEDNGLGISVRTPRGWVAQALQAMPGIRYVAAEGDPSERWAAVAAAIERVREDRAPLALHLPTVRLWAHAGSDVEEGYRSREEIRAGEERDPLLDVARWLVSSGRSTGADLQGDRDEVRSLVEDAVARVQVRHAGSAAEVLGPLLADPAEAVADPPDGVPARARAAAWAHGSGAVPEQVTVPLRRTLAARINQALHDLLLADRGAVLFGQDVGRKGGVYGVTTGLQAQFGTARVFDTHLDETAILGAAQGYGLLGYLPVPEIQYLAYLHNALDQLRGEACSTAWFSNDAFRTPMVLRVAAFAYQRGFGGHFHNDNAIGALRDIPGLLIATPGRGDDAVRMLRAATLLARRQGRVVAFLEPIALYHQRDLHDEGDDGWLTSYPSTGVLAPGHIGVHPAGRFGVVSQGIGGTDLPTAPTPLDQDLAMAGPDDAADVVVVTYANGVPMALRVARRVAEEGVRIRVVDLRWLQPLALDAIEWHARNVGRVLVVDECRATGGGVADAIVAGLVERGVRSMVASVRARDSYVPLGPAAAHVLVGEEDIQEAALDLARTPR